MKNDKYNKEYAVIKDSFYLKAAPALFFWIIFSFISIMLMMSFVAIIIDFQKIGILLEDIIGLILGAFVILVIPTSLINQFSSIRVTEYGLHIQIFIFYYKWIFIPWSDVIEIRLSPLYDRWKKPVWVIKVRQATYINRILSFYYRTGTGYGVIVTSDIKNREQMLKAIEYHIT